MNRVIVILCFASYCIGMAEGGLTQEWCVWESFEARCSDNKVLLIEKASFGRLRSGRCFNLTRDEKPCYADVQSFVERHCGGMRDCAINLKNENLKLFPGNCSIYSQKSLEIEYKCINVYAVQDKTCVSNQSLLVTTSSGYLANIVTDETGQGSQLCPWRFQPGPGQTVHLILLDFGVWIDRAERDRRNICRIYATIKKIEATHRKSDILVCGGVQREKFIMSTDTEITIGMMKQENTDHDTAYFIVKYQAVPEKQHTTEAPELCPEIFPSNGASIEMTEKGYRVSCPDGDSVELLCRNGSWIPSQPSKCLAYVMYIGQDATASTFNAFNAIYLVAGVAGLFGIVSSLVALILCLRLRRKNSAALADLDPTEPFASEYDLIPYAITDGYDTIEVDKKDDILFPKLPPRHGPLPTPGYAALMPDEPKPPGVYSRMDHKQKKLLSDMVRSKTDQSKLSDIEESTMKSTIRENSYLFLTTESNDDIAEGEEIPSTYLKMTDDSLQFNTENNVVQIIQLEDPNSYLELISKSDKEIGEDSDEIPSAYLRMTDDSLQAVMNSNVQEAIPEEEISSSYLTTREIDSSALQHNMP